MSQLFRRTAVAFLLFAGSASAQSVSGSISGTVVDPSHQVVPGATVTLIDEQTGRAAHRADQRDRQRSCFVRAAAGALHRPHRDDRIQQGREEEHHPAGQRAAVASGTITLAGRRRERDRHDHGRRQLRPDRQLRPLGAAHRQAARDGGGARPRRRVAPARAARRVVPGRERGAGRQLRHHHARTSAATATPGTRSPSTGWSATTSAARRSSAARSTSTRSAK